MVWYDRRCHITFVMIFLSGSCFRCGFLACFARFSFLSRPESWVVGVFGSSVRHHPWICFPLLIPWAKSPAIVCSERAARHPGCYRERGDLTPGPSRMARAFGRMGRDGMDLASALDAQEKV